MTTSDSEKALIFKMLHRLLLDIRFDANQGQVNTKKLYELSHLFHNVPLQLARPDPNYSAILAELADNAEQNPGLKEWLAEARK